jgi:hypothetical protein
VALLDLFRRKQPLTAAASVADSGNQLDRTSVQAREVGDAWKVWREVGEIHYATTQQARVLSRIGWDIAVNGQNVDESDPEMAEEMMKAAFGKNFRDLSRQMALHLQVAGAYRFVRVDDKWHVLGMPLDYRGKELVKRADVDILVENPDPREATRMDSPVLACMDVARELLLTRAQARAAARNRTAQLGLLLYPLEVAGGNTKAFEKKLARAMAAPIENEMSASSVVPNMVGMQADYIEKWKTLDLSGDIDEKLHERINRLVHQIAVILDSPMELLEGMGDTNHWTAWAVQEDNWRAHVEPMASLVAEGFALAFAQAADIDPEAIDIVPDPAPLLERRPALSDIKDAHAARVINDDFYRDALGADEADAPDPSDDPVQTSDSGSGPRAVQEPAEPVAAAVPALVERLRGPLAALAAAPPPLPDAMTLAHIDTQAYDSMEDLLADTVERVLTRLGSKVLSIAQGKDLGLGDLKRMTNADIAVAYAQSGRTWDNLDDVVQASVLAEEDKVHRIVNRAYRRTGDAGVSITYSEDLQADTQAAFVGFAAQAVHAALQARGLGLWGLAHRIVNIAGGGGDPQPQVAAPGIATTALGIALGRNAVEAILNTYAAVPGGYTWFHQAGGDNHPQHLALNGRSFNGQYVLEDGINWFPGDHAGCRCIAVPEFQRVG